MELRRALVGVSVVSRGAVTVIGNLLALAWALHMRSSVVSSMSRWACKVGRLMVYKPEGAKPPRSIFKKMLESILEVGTRR